MIGRILPFRVHAAVASAGGGAWAMSMSPRPEDPTDSKGRPDVVAQLRPPLSAPRGPADIERFRQLMLPHLDGAYGLARYLCRDPAAAEDIVQDAFLRAWRGFDGFRGSSPRAWLFAIVRNCFFSWTRSGPAVGPDPAESFDTIATDEDDPEAALLRRDEAAVLHGLIEALPEPFREALVLRELEELSYREIAEVTSAPIGTVMSRLARARQLLCAAVETSRSGEDPR